MMEISIYFDVFFCDVTNLDDPPRQDGDVLDGLGRKEVSAAFPEKSEFPAGPGRVHEIDVLIAADPKQAEAVGRREIGQRVVTLLLRHQRLQHGHVVLEGRHRQPLDDHVSQVIGEQHEALPTVLDQLLVILFLIFANVTNCYRKKKLDCLFCVLIQHY